MTKESLTGLVILMNGQKQLIQTKRIRVYQRENMIDKLRFLIPLVYEGMDLQPFKVTLQYLDSGGTVFSESLERLSDGQGGYEDYEDKDGNPTHMIYTLGVASNLTKWSGDITMKLTMDYTDQAGQTSSDSDEEPAPEPTPIHYVINTDTTILTVLPVADYYSIVPDESLSIINQKIAELAAKQEELEATAAVYDEAKADNIQLDTEDKSLYLTSNGKLVGDKIDLNDMGEALTEDTEAGLIKVIT